MKVIFNINSKSKKKLDKNNMYGYMRKYNGIYKNKPFSLELRTDIENGVCIVIRVDGETYSKEALELTEKVCQFLEDEAYNFTEEGYYIYVSDADSEESADNLFKEVKDFIRKES